MDETIRPKARRHRLHILASRLHKWLALVIGVQLLLWFASGAIMSFLPIGEVRGEHLVDRGRQVPIPVGARLADTDRLIAAASGPVESLTLRMVDGRPVAEIATAGGTSLIDARTAAVLGQVDRGAAARIAGAAWRNGPVPQSTVSAVRKESTEYRGPLPAWRVAFADKDATAVYVAANTGRITAVRTGTWRFYDLFWGLHIMDWKNHENTNSPWLFGFALGALVLALAGSVLLFMRWPRRRRR